MPLGKDVDELLSGYLDGQLTADELRWIETALQTTPDMSVRLEGLRESSALLRRLASQPGQGLPPDFTQRVMARCSELQGVDRLAENSVARHPLVPGISSNDSVRQAHRRKFSRPTWQIASSLAVLAGMIFLALSLPQRWSDRDATLTVDNGSVSTSGSADSLESSAIDRSNDATTGDATSGHLADNGENVSPSLPGDVSPGSNRSDLVASGKVGVPKISYALVLDLELSQEAVDQNVLQSLLSKYGIELVRGVQLNEEIEAAVNRMRYTVREDQQSKVAELYLVRAPSEILDAALAEMESEIELFPNYRFDLAFETPTVSLSQAIANAMGQQMVASESFAVPVVPGDAGSITPSPFDSIPYQGTLVNSSARRERFDSASSELPMGNDASFLLILARQP